MDALVNSGWLTVNRACNFRCPWCYGSSTKFDTKETMPIGLAKKLINLMKGIGVKGVVLIGGEPTIYRHLTEVLSYSVGLGIRPTVVTNGVRLARMEFVSSLKATGLQGLTISIKTTDSKEYNMLASRGKGVLEDVFRGVQNVLAAGLILNLSVTITDSFIGKLDQLVDLLVRLNPSNVSIDMGSPVVTESGVEAVGILDPFKLRDAATQLYRMLRETTLRYSFGVSIPLCIFNEEVRIAMINDGRIHTSCHVSKGAGVVFGPAGDVILCNHFPSFPLGRFGVDFTSPEQFTDYWRSEELAEIRTRSTLYPHERCQTCPDWDICGGGCFVKWLHWDPQTYIPRKEVRK